VPVHGRRDRAEQVAGDPLGLAGHPALDPDLVDRLPPAGEQADAVAGRGDRVQVLEQARPGQALEGALAYLVGRPDVQGDAGDHPERPQPDDQPVEVGIAPGGGQGLAGGGDQLQAGDRGGQAAVGVARAVGAGGHGARDRDVGQ
jgi:hypothetical protein